MEGRARTDLKNTHAYFDEDAYFYKDQSQSSSSVTLSQFNNKSSVLCLESQDITSQYLALQQLDAHQRMISRAKGCVDTSAPKSLKSYRSVAGQKKKQYWKQLHMESLAPVMNRSFDDRVLPSSSRTQSNQSDEDENDSANISSVNKAIQTGIPYAMFSSRVADKISWYLEALSQGELQPQPLFYMENSSSVSTKHSGKFSNTYQKRRVLKGDIMEQHPEYFIQPKKPFSPRILAEKTAKSKLKEMRCYNPPFRKKKSGSSQSSDTFESYDDDGEEENEMDEKSESQKYSDHSSSEEDTHISRKFSKERCSNYNVGLSPLLYQHYEKNSIHENHTALLNKSEEDKYLDFLSKVTEDILRSGIYSDKAIQQAFEFHMPFYEDDTNKEKLQSLLQQVLEGLKITSDDCEEIMKQSSLPISLSRTNTPPEKENSDILMHSNPSKTELSSLSLNEHTFSLTKKQNFEDIPDDTVLVHNNLTELKSNDS